MAAWKSLTKTQLAALSKSLAAGLDERGIEAAQIDLDPSGLRGRYRLYVVSPDFTKLDFSERLRLLQDCVTERWTRPNQLRITLMMPLSPDELPDEFKQPRRRAVTQRSR